MENTDNLEFHYTYDGREIGTLPFRPGDLVWVTDWGGIYDMYTDAFLHFGLGTKGERPYYCKLSWNDRKEECPKTRLFKVMGVAKHSWDNFIVMHIKDIENKSAVITGTYLKPAKVYPLRKGETREIELEKIKQ